MRLLEYYISKIYIMLIFYPCCLLPINMKKVVFASPRDENLRGNLLFIHKELSKKNMDLKYIYILEKYGYSLAEKIKYALRLARGAYHLATARLFLLDNAYFPVHVVRHRKATLVVQLWHAAGAVKKFGADAPSLSRQVESRFVHQNYDIVIASSAFAAKHYATAFKTAPHQVLPMGAPRTDFLFDSNAMEESRQRILSSYPSLKSSRVLLYAPTYRGQGLDKHQAILLNTDELRQKLDSDWKLVYKPHPTVSPGECRGFDVVAGNDFELNEWFTVADALVTDYSSSLIEWALLYKPLVLLVPDLKQYEAEPGFYFEFKREIIGHMATNTAEVAEYLSKRCEDYRTSYDNFIKLHLDAPGISTERVVRFLTNWMFEEKF